MNSAPDLLLEDERAFLASSGRCTKCKHLTALHNFHCCTSCTVPGCACEWCYCDECNKEAVRERDRFNDKFNARP